jgi:hypothetical protein
MHKRSLLALLTVLLVSMIAAPTSSVSAQSAAAEKPALYTYVSLFAVPRAQWSDFEKAEMSDESEMKKLAADGTIVGWGTFVRVAHQEGEPTHGDWFSATSQANLMKALEALIGTGTAKDPVYMNTKHWDEIYESRDYNRQPGTFTNAYLRVGLFKYKEGSPQAAEITRASFIKVLDGMVADGSLHGYQIDREAVHTRDANSFSIVLFTNGAEGLDKFTDAIANMAKKDPAGTLGFESNIDEKGHIDELYRVPSMTNK